MSEQQAADEALQTSEQRFRSIAAQLFDIVMIVDAEGVVRYVNDALTRVLGHAAGGVHRQERPRERPPGRRRGRRAGTRRRPADAAGGRDDGVPRAARGRLVAAARGHRPEPARRPRHRRSPDHEPRHHRAAPGGCRAARQRGVVPAARRAVARRDLPPQHRRRRAVRLREPVGGADDGLHAGGALQRPGHPAEARAPGRRPDRRRERAQHSRRRTRRRSSCAGSARTAR